MIHTQWFQLNREATIIRGTVRRLARQIVLEHYGIFVDEDDPSVQNEDRHRLRMETGDFTYEKEEELMRKAKKVIKQETLPT